VDRYARDYASNVLAYGHGFGGAANALGLSTLNQLLASQGKTDPRMANMQRANIQRGTQQSQQGAQAGLAQAGLTGSGLGQAL